jgi:hypothetical protein
VTQRSEVDRVEQEESYLVAGRRTFDVCVRDRSMVVEGRSRTKVAG